MFLKNLKTTWKKIRKSKPKPRENYRNTVVGGQVLVAPRNIPGVFEISARSHIAEGIILSGRYESGVIDALSRLNLGAGIVVNIGANVGLIAAWLARQLNREVIAIEPNPEAYQLLQRNIAGNELGARIQAVQVCIGAKQGTVDFSVIEGKPEYSSIGGITHPAVAHLPQRIIQVPVVSLDEVVGNRKVALIFVDVEGAEGLVFQGGVGVFRRDKPTLVFECSDRLLQKFGWSSRQIEDDLTAWGYRLQPIDPRHPAHHPLEGEYIAAPIKPL